MNPGPIEGTTQIASEAIGALKTSPNCLLAILLAGLFALLTYFSLTAERRESHERALATMERCFPMALMQAVRDNAMEGAE